jgi:RNA polymerase sigma-70 factor (sigma-E family)
VAESTAILPAELTVPDHVPEGGASFDRYVRERSQSLLRLAFLLTGDHHLAEDLVQTALARVLPRWPSIVERGDPHAYVRKVLVHTATGWRRRKWTGERATADVPDRPVGVDAESAAAQHERLRVALLGLAPRQRAAVVLRHYEDLTEAQTAAALGCGVGTVKSQTAKGLGHLRHLLSDDPQGDHHD